MLCMSDNKVQIVAVNRSQHLARAGGMSPDPSQTQQMPEHNHSSLQSANIAHPSAAAAASRSLASCLSDCGDFPACCLAACTVACCGCLPLASSILALLVLLQASNQGHWLPYCLQHVMAAVTTKHSLHVRNGVTSNVDQNSRTHCVW